jgi:hypothetical protein
VTEPLDPDEAVDPELEARLRAHFADRADREPLPGDAPPPIAPRAPRTWWQRPPMLAAAAALLVVALVGALALRDDDPERLEVTDSSTTTEVTTPDTTTSTTSTSTTTPETTTTAPTTTTTTVPAASTVRSVIVSADGVLGWWDGSRFVRWQDGEVPLSGGEEYVVVGLGGSSTATGSAPHPGCGITQPEPLLVDIPGLDASAVLQPSPVAVTGVADPSPRATEAIGAGPYVAAAVEALAEAGIADPSPQLAQVLRTDLEGDGSEEVLIVVERLSDPEHLFAQPGDYSVLLLRQVVDGVVVTSHLSVSRAAESGDPYIVVNRVAAVADLNGDGTMEVVTRHRYYEGASSAVSVVDPAGGASEVLAVGCGA